MLVVIPAMLAIPLSLAPSSIAARSAPNTALPAAPGALEAALGEVKLGAGGISLNQLEVKRLSALLAQLKGISGLAGLTGLGTKGLEQSITKAIEGLAVHEDKLSEVLDPTILGPKLEGSLSEALGPILGSELGILVKTLLAESPQTAISEGLSSTDLDELLGSLASSASNPEQLLSGLFMGIPAAQQESLFGSQIVGEFAKTTAAEAASKLETTVQALSQELGTTLQPATTILTATLENSEEVSVLPGSHSLVVGLLHHLDLTDKSEGEGGAGNSEGQGTGESGTGEPGAGEGTEKLGVENPGSGNNNSPGDPGSPTGSQSPPKSTETATSQTPSLGSAVVDQLLAQTSTSAPKTAALTKIKILSHRVKGRRVTLVVLVPAAGAITLRAKHLKTISRKTTSARHLTLRATLSRAVAAALHRHRKPLRVKLEVSFVPLNGAGSRSTAIAIVR